MAPEDRGLAGDGRNERGDDGNGEGDTNEGADEAAAHAAHAGQADALAEARFLENLAEREPADDDDGHFREPRRIHHLLLHAAQDDVQHREDKPHGDFVHGVHRPHADRPRGDGEEHGHLIRNGLTVYGNEEIDDNGDRNGYDPLHCQRSACSQGWRTHASSPSEG